MQAEALAPSPDVPYRLPVGAMVNARLGHLVYGATDPKAGAVRSVYELLDGDRLNHRVE